MATMSMDFSKLLSQIDSVSTKKTYADKNEGYWKLTQDKAGNGAAVIHFLPNQDISEIPFVRTFSHAFKNEETGRWYIENSLSTINAPDYVSEVNRELWNSGLDENKEIVRKQKRKLSYESNIYVVKDLGNPDNNGKVFKFRYGQKIFDKIVAAAKPDESLGESPCNAYDPINGAEFLLKMKKVAGFPNYDESKFNSAKPMFDGNDAKIQGLLDQCANLNDIISPDKFKTYDELKDRYLWVMGLDDKSKGKTKPATVSKSMQDQFDADDADLDAISKVVADKPARKVPPMPVMESVDDDSDAAFFSSLIND